jgi:predicted outer membrane repeat protein
MMAAIIAMLVAVVVPTPVSAGTLIEVQPGESIQLAIDAASSGDTINVAAGTYYENISWNNKDLVIMGAGADITIIDGSSSDSVVITRGLTNAARLEGFTIQNGDSLRGGGMWNQSNSSPTVSNCIFLHNSANNGGGMYNYGNSSPVVTECTFSGNSATIENGGGMINDAFCSPIVTDCTFVENTAYFLGGGMYNLRNCSPIVTGCTFIGNEAEYGGGMANRDFCDPVLNNCNFDGNKAKLRDIILWGFGGVGGGVYNSKASPILTNCIFSENSAEVYGGGLYGRDRSKPKITNCTFVSNISLLEGSILAFDSHNQASPNTVQISNCILWDNGNGIWNNDSSSITITYSDVQGSGGSSSWVLTSAIDGGGNIDEDPLLDYALYLQSGSPCIDAGDNTKVPAGIITDFHGDDRFFDDSSTLDTGNGIPPIVDIGADEYISPAGMVEILSNDVDAMDLPQGTEKRFTTSLYTAMKVLEDSNKKNDVAAMNALGSFINKLEAQRGKKIPGEVADELITKAQEIIAALSGGA